MVNVPCFSFQQVLGISYNTPKYDIKYNASSHTIKYEALEIFNNGDLLLLCVLPMKCVSWISKMNVGMISMNVFCHCKVEGIN